MTETTKRLKSPTFAVGYGRSGTHFLSEVMRNDKNLAAYHLDNGGHLIADSFLKYCTWNNLPVDIEGFLKNRENAITSAKQSHKTYFEANPYLSLNIDPLFQRFDANFVFIVRRPEDNVNSNFVKGWYQTPPVKGDLNLCLGYQYELKEGNHFFGRIVPQGKEYLRWSRLTQIGRISWMWNALNLKIIEQLEGLPEEKYIIIKMEEFDYEKYLQVHQFIGGIDPMIINDFEELRLKKPGKGRWQRKCSTWSQREWDEFFAETQQARTVLKYRTAAENTRAAHKDRRKSILNG